ncbi:uncharacterized protein BJ171DRAFT_555012 [Polychytrium aggregatum]|uniref:uncharacterized protein n=1 Tax=Polychytrium aggregatum TaxID=110093 RepID=UPI0022FF36F3|nr:uncharacterized protein BJ171DRAFT_555012 [Polychytrium aggregatum]KAI9179341.1 hypothetical protein BJ171DRAFT_555012 [Polychytrium aggregatum]
MSLRSTSPILPTAVSPQWRSAPSFPRSHRRRVSASPGHHSRRPGSIGHRLWLLVVSLFESADDLRRKPSSPLMRLWILLRRPLGLASFLALLFMLWSLWNADVYRFTEHHLRPKSLLLDPVCLGYQSAMTFSTFVQGGVSDVEPCSKLVEEARVDLTTWPVSYSDPTRHNLSSLISCQDVEDCGVEWIVQASRCHPSLNRLAQTARNLGVTFTVLGYGQRYRGDGHNFRQLHDYLLNLPTTDIVDVYRRFDHPIVIGTEEHCWPDGQLWNKYPPIKPEITRKRGDTPYKYVKSGALMGPAGLVRGMIKTLYNSECAMEQRLLTSAVVKKSVFWHGRPDGLPRVLNTERGERPQHGEDPRPLVSLDVYQDLFTRLRNMHPWDFVVDTKTKRVRTWLRDKHIPNSCILHEVGGNRKPEGMLIGILADQLDSAK